MNDGTAEIIQLFGARPKPGKKISARSEPASRIPQPQSEEVASDTCSNQRLRAKRRDIWREADTVMDYWHLSLKMDSAIFRVQHHGTPESDMHSPYKPADHWTLVAKYREAWARLMLTPAPDAQAVVRKRAQINAENHKHTDLKPERIAHQIADDVEFLRSHPTRRGGHYSPKRDQEQ